MTTMQPSSAYKSGDFVLNGWSRASTLLGVAVWLGAFALSVADPARLDSAELLLLLALFVVTPLSLALVAPTDPNDHRATVYRAAMLAQPVAALLAAASFAVQSGLLAAALVLPWLLFMGLVALYGFMRLVASRFSRVDEVCIAFGLLYLPIGAAWLILARFGARPLGFAEIIVFLTAIHFHFIPLTALVLTGLVGRRLAEVRPSAWPIYRVAALGVIIGPALVAGGITFSLLLETIAAVVLAGSLVTVGALTLVYILPATHPRLGRGLLVASSFALFVAMSFAVAYALGRWTGAWTLTIPRMIQGHGWVNALGFGLCGLLAWRLVNAKP